MKKKIVILLFLIGGFTLRTEAQVTDWIPIIGTLVKKVIQAIDLKIQRLQNETIGLQNAEKELENTMAALKLGEISDWVQKQYDLYSEYYQELKTVKDIIAGYEKVKQVVSLQEKLVSEFNKAWGLMQQDSHFTPDELKYMSTVYTGILSESAKNVDQVLMVVNSFVTQMSDAARMGIIDRAAKAMQQNYNDLKAFNNQNIILSLQRSEDANDIETTKRLYNLE